MVKIIKHDNALEIAAAVSGKASGTLTTLDTLAPGQCASIARVTADGGLRMHLMELGFVAGSSITFLMSTPFRDPNIYCLRGTSIALRKSEARCIQVTI